jgi:hypothetical protein
MTNAATQSFLGAQDFFQGVGANSRRHSLGLRSAALHKQETRCFWNCEEKQEKERGPKLLRSGFKPPFRILSTPGKGLTIGS